MKKYELIPIEKILSNRYFGPVNNLFTPFFSGIGTIVMMHRVVADKKDIICNDLEVTSDHLEEIINFFIRNNYEVVSLNKAYEIITGKSKSGKKFVVFTFDDGYEDNYSLAYPIFKKYNLPFAIYITTSFPDKTALLWWYALKDLINKKKTLHFTFDERTYVYDAKNLKNNAYFDIRRLILSLDAAQQEVLFHSLFEENGINLPQYAIEAAMSWEQVEELAQDRIVTIGAHTINHYNLRTLDAKSVKKEILDSRKRIESVIGKKVEHFAFPFGSQNEADKREVEIAGELGFKTCTTTRCGNIFPKHALYMSCLPRITPNPNFISAFPQTYASGFIPALKQKFRRVITT